ncbi:hypothetical protein [Cellvibrio sp.]
MKSMLALLNKNRISKVLPIGAALLVVLTAYITLKPAIELIEIQSKADIWQAEEFVSAQTTAEDAAYLKNNYIWSTTKANNINDSTNKNPTTLKDWKLKGIIKEGNEFCALIEVLNPEKSKLEILRLFQGDSLPNNELLIEITEQAIYYEFEDAKNQRTLYQNPNNGIQ